MSNSTQARINQINQMYAAYAQAEIRIAKQLQKMQPLKTWTECLQEAKIYVGRHGINIALIED